ncbi:hypothetical protein [Mucilaginibacter terrae]|uniref:Uncharacterized protein n=1 Tax=Mucilaginibacter terrae TaxID=1955052 RepID=A0ABU3GVF1_9SPHI|nr:hypothetical protein [Mucilaginibacter terrae]MDT3403749.1 hypothetical protein [Mucilaginibacter terrae]
MLRASALHMVIVIALVIAVICSSLITAAYFYRLQYQKTVRYHQLEDNLSSAINMITVGAITPSQKFSLFNTVNDTVLVERREWGLFDIGIARAFIQSDTIRKAFSIASLPDSAKQSALYIIDEDRNISVSGKTEIRGTAYLPKAGIKQAYVNSQAYQGDSRLVIGEKKVSGRELPELNTLFLKRIEAGLKPTNKNDSIGSINEMLTRSFLKETLHVNAGKQVITLSTALWGNIIIHSDTLLVIDSTAKFDNILIFAKAIKVSSGFKGNCQLFASDSISVGANCRFNYPSVLAVAGFDATPKGQRKLAIGHHTQINGVLLVYEKAKTELLPVIMMDKQSEVKGQIYCNGLINYQDGTEIKGSVYTKRFLYQTGYTRYENYLINIRINRPALSKYYLSSCIFPSVPTNQFVLQWLN